MAVNANINYSSQNKQERFNLKYEQAGYGAIVPIINGERRDDMVAGCTSEADAQAYINLVRMALEESDGDIAKAKVYMMNAVSAAANK